MPLWTTRRTFMKAALPWPFYSASGVVNSSVPAQGGVFGSRFFRWCYNQIRETSSVWLRTEGPRVSTAGK